MQPHLQVLNELNWNFKISIKCLIESMDVGRDKKISENPLEKLLKFSSMLQVEVVKTTKPGGEKGKKEKRKARTRHKYFMIRNYLAFIMAKYHKIFSNMIGMNVSAVFSFSLSSFM